MTNHQDVGQVRVMRLRHALQALALPVDVQLKLLPESVCKADELALDFDHWFTAIQSNASYTLTPMEQARLVALDTMLTTMSGSEQQELWTDEALVHNPQWEKVRTLAQAALKVFGWPPETPPRYDHEVIRGTEEKT